VPASDSSHRPYVSRRKRRRISEEVPLLSNRSMLGLLGLLVLGLIVSLGIIAVQMADPEIETTGQQYSAAPATKAVSQ
jgi:hypothetical protein